MAAARLQPLAHDDVREVDEEAADALLRDVEQPDDDRPPRALEPALDEQR